MWYKEPRADINPTELFDVLKAERKLIQERRSRLARFQTRGVELIESNEVTTDDVLDAEKLRLTGIALSGGGIRSATFCLGFLQALNHRDLLARFDYLSTVSGGGFIGSWWTAWVKRQHDSRHPKTSDQNYQCSPNVNSLFPPRERVPFTRGSPRVDPLETDQFGSSLSDRASDPVRHLRRYSNYLTPRRGVASADTWRAIVILAGNQLIALAVLLPFLLAGTVFAQLYFVARAGNAVSEIYLAPTLTPEMIAVRLKWVWEPLVALLAWALVLLPLRLLRGGVTSARFGFFTSIGLITSCLAGVFYYAYQHNITRPYDLPTLLSIWVVIATALIAVYGVGPALLEWIEQPEQASGFVARSEAIIIRIQMRLVGAAAAIGPLLLLGGFGHELSKATANVFPVSARPSYLLIVVAAGLLALGLALRAGLTPQSLRRSVKSEKKTLFVVAAATVVFTVVIVLAQFSAFGLRALRTASQADPELTNRVAYAALASSSLILIGFALYEGLTEWNAGPTRRGTPFWRTAMIFAATILSIGGYAFFQSAFLAPAGFIGAVAGILAFRMLVVTARDGVSLNFRWTRDPSGGMPMGSQTPKSDLVRIAILCLVAGPVFGLGLAEWAYHDNANLAIRTNLQTAWVAVGVIVLCGLSLVYELIWWRQDNWRAVALAAVGAVPSTLLIVAFYFLNGGEAVTLVGLSLSAISVALAIGIIVGFLADVNEVSLHGFYRDRLVRAYLGASNPDSRRTDTDPTEPYSSDDMLLCDAASRCADAPYHLINATRSLVGGRDLETAQRGGESFLFSPLYCGSASLRFRPTEHYMKGKITVGTAMAVSGAAASPTMAAKARSASVAMLLTLANVRLGYWAPAPNGSRWHMMRPRLWPFYVLREFFASTASGSPYVYLTDGGHFDNTGLYALIARGCTQIVVVDCGADPDGVCGDMGDVVRRCRIDFGAEISFTSTPNLKTGKPVSKDPRFVVGEVVYHPTHTAWLRGHEANRSSVRSMKGTIVWVKPSVAFSDTPDLKQYASDNGTFPQESTIQQWYGETQFESYRQLGYLVGLEVASQISRTQA